MCEALHDCSAHFPPKHNKKAPLSPYISLSPRDPEVLPMPSIQQLAPCLLYWQVKDQLGNKTLVTNPPLTILKSGLRATRSTNNSEYFKMDILLFVFPRQSVGRTTFSKVFKTTLNRVAKERIDPYIWQTPGKAFDHNVFITNFCPKNTFWFLSSWMS